MVIIAKPSDFGIPIDRTVDSVNTVDDFITLPSRITAFVMDLVRVKFSMPENIYRHELKSLIYDADVQKSRIQIQASFENLNTKKEAELLPRIVVSPIGMSLSPEVGNITGSRSIIPDAVHSRDIRQGNFMSYTGEIDIRVIATGGLEAMLIAEDLFLWLLLFNSQIMCDLHLSNFDIKVLSGPQRDGAFGPFFINLKIGWAADMSWTTNKEIPALSTGSIYSNIK